VNGRREGGEILLTLDVNAEAREVERDPGEERGLGSQGVQAILRAGGVDYEGWGLGGH
jgi:hypothetical protein